MFIIMLLVRNASTDCMGLSIFPRPAYLSISTALQTYIAAVPILTAVPVITNPELPKNVCFLIYLQMINAVITAQSTAIISVTLSENRAVQALSSSRSASQIAALALSVLRVR